MTRPSREMKRISFFVPELHAEIVRKLAKRRGISSSDVYRAMLKKYLQAAVKQAQQKEEPT